MRRGKILIVYACGVLAAIALGKIAPVGPLLQSDFGLSLTQLGWMMSAITTVTALLGAPAGLWARRHGARLALLVGLAVIAAAGELGAASWGATTLVASRVLEGIGYLFIVTSGPSLIARLTRNEEAALALALWGTFIPVGLAASAVLGGVLALNIGWRGWLGLTSALPAIAAVLAAVALPADKGEEAIRRPPLRLSGLARPGLLAAGFCSISPIGVAVLGVLPIFLVEQRGVGLAYAGVATAIVSFSSVPGSLLVGWLMRRGIGLRVLLLGGLLIPAVAVLVFRRDGTFGVSVAAAIALLLVYGGMIAGMFATVPRVIQDPSHLDLANGFLAQLGSLGTLLGPPVFSAAVTAAGWVAIAPVALAFALAGLGLWTAALATRRG